MPVSLEQLLQKIDEVFTKDMPFMHQFSAEVLAFDAESVRLQFAMSDRLIGNTLSKILHGGSIATMLDTVGGMVTMAAMFAKRPDDELVDHMERVARTSTVNLLINFLRPGIGKEGDHFIAEAEVVRSGKRITVCELNLKNQDGKLLASGTGTYMNGEAS